MYIHTKLANIHILITTKTKIKKTFYILYKRPTLELVAGFETGKFQHYDDYGM